MAIDRQTPRGEKIEVSDMQMNEGLVSRLGSKYTKRSLPEEYHADLDYLAKFAKERHVKTTGELLDKLSFMRKDTYITQSDPFQRRITLVRLLYPKFVMARNAGKETIISDFQERAKIRKLDTRSTKVIVAHIKRNNLNDLGDVFEYLGRRAIPDNRNGEIKDHVAVRLLHVLSQAYPKALMKDIYMTALRSKPRLRR
jgi:hypothetical protein